MKKLLLLLFAIPVFISSAQNIDSLYNVFLRVRGINQNVKPRVADETDLPIKCGFGIINQIKTNYDKFSFSQKKVINSLLQRPATDTSFVSPRGWFRIHYNKTGFDAPGYDVNEAAKAADSSYNYEVNFLDYPSSPGDAGAGGDDRYDIYIQNLSNLYGYTEFEQNITDSTYTAFTVIHNNFGSNFYTKGIDAARVTIAHEFHHAIQIGNYIYRDKDRFYHELTSTSMEEFVYPSIDDYIQYVASYFRNPQQTFNNINNSNNGYDLAIWNIFLRDRFSADVIKLTWELMPTERALNAIDKAIQQKQVGSNFKTEFNLFGQWTYFTGVRDNGKYFKEAAHYPLINPTEIANSITVSSQAVSNNFFKMYYFTSGGKDSVITLITNSNIAGGIASPISTLLFTYTLSSSPITDGKKIAENFYSKLEPQSFILSEANILSGNVMSAAIDYPFPQPFRYSVNNQIFIPTSKSDDGLVDLYIYSAGMNLVYSSQKRIVASDPAFVIWEGRDNNNNKLGTGVYIYVTKSGDTVKKGKLVIQND